jgi:hypothetical protein
MNKELKKQIKDKLKGYLDLIITLIIFISMAIFFFGLLPVHDCNLQVINYSCSMWGFM